MVYCLSEGKGPGEAAILTIGHREDGPLWAIASCERAGPGRGERGAAKAHLIRALLNHFNEIVSASGDRTQDQMLAHARACESNRILGNCYSLSTGRLGRPVLRFRGRRGPAVSFTHLDTTTWAALASDGCKIGIDAARRDEFVGDYPFRRAFGPDEFDAIPSAMVHDLPGAAAAIWSVKEAVVKALECGFWSIDPLEVYISGWRRTGHGWTSQVSLSENARKRFMSSELRNIYINTFNEHETWISTTIIPKQSP